MPMRIQICKNDEFDNEQNGLISVHLWNWRNNEDGGERKKITFQSKFKLVPYKSEDNTWSSADETKPHERNT